MLDAGPLGLLARRRPRQEIVEWFRDIAASRTVVIVPEVADYEVRREFLLARLRESLGLGTPIICWNPARVPENP